MGRRVGRIFISIRSCRQNEQIILCHATSRVVSSQMFSSEAFVCYNLALRSMRWLTIIVKNRLDPRRQYKGKRDTIWKAVFVFETASAKGLTWTPNAKSPIIPSSDELQLMNNYSRRDHLVDHYERPLMRINKCFCIWSLVNNWSESKRCEKAFVSVNCVVFIQSNLYTFILLKCQCQHWYKHASARKVSGLLFYKKLAQYFEEMAGVIQRWEKKSQCSYFKDIWFYCTYSLL